MEGQDGGAGWGAYFHPVIVESVQTGQVLLMSLLSGFGACGNFSSLCTFDDALFVAGPMNRRQS